MSLKGFAPRFAGLMPTGRITSVTSRGVNMIFYVFATAAIAMLVWRNV